MSLLAVPRNRIQTRTLLFPAFRVKKAGATFTSSPCPDTQANNIFSALYRRAQDWRRAGVA